MPRSIAALLLSTSALLFVASVARAANPPPAPPAAPCSGPEYHQFDFWVGTGT